MGFCPQNAHKTSKKARFSSKIPPNLDLLSYQKSEHTSNLFNYSKIKTLTNHFKLAIFHRIMV